jgi:hypothetical protein
MKIYMVHGADNAPPAGPRSSSRSQRTLKTATRKNRLWERCRLPTRTKTKLLGVRMVVNNALEFALVLAPCSPPYSYDGRRAQWGTRIHVPCPLLGAP